MAILLLLALAGCASEGKGHWYGSAGGGYNGTTGTTVRPQR